LDRIVTVYERLLDPIGELVDAFATGLPVRHQSALPYGAACLGLLLQRRFTSGIGRRTEFVFG
jgi:hypothetical protein